MGSGDKNLWKMWTTLKVRGQWEMRKLFSQNRRPKLPLVTGGKWKKVFSPKGGPLGQFPSSGYWEKSHQAIHSMGLTAQVFWVNGDGR